MFERAKFQSLNAFKLIHEEFQHVSTRLKGSGGWLKQFQH